MIKVAQMLDPLTTVTLNSPGILRGGLSRGLLWHNSEDLGFDDNLQGKVE
jgi:hypothetical protein